MSQELPSNSAIDRAGRYLREYQAGRIEEIDIDRVEDSIAIVTRFREAHAKPMASIRMGLEFFKKTEGLDAAITQRHKRVPRIIRKLQRMNGTRLSRLEDIGGCRVVVNSIAEMDVIGARIIRAYKKDFVRDCRDYISNPKPMGYRAHHYVVQRHGRAIEIQVRTRGQQRWADAVESIDNRLSAAARFGWGEPVQLKDEIGPEVLKTYFRLAAEVIWLTEADLPIPPVLRSRFIRSRSAVIEEGFYSA